MSMQADWTELMTAMTARIAVRQLADRSVAVDLQNPMWEHDYVTVLVQETPGGWRLSDAGVTALELDSLGQLCEHSACAGLDLDLDEDELVTHVSADLDGSDAMLASTVVRFAAQLASVPTMARLLDCATSTKSTSKPEIFTQTYDPVGGGSDG